MSSVSVTLPWGTGSLDVPLPAGWRLLGELRPRSVPAPADPGAACSAALREPIGCPPLAGRPLAGRSVLLVVDDHSRPTPVRELLPAVLAELVAAGVRDGDLEVLIATGVHRPSRPEEVLRKLGAEAMGRLRWSCHDAHDSAGLVDLGRTSRGTPVRLNRKLAGADLIICLGAVEPHLLLGFGGGLKMLLPGCAGAETIGRNHLQGVEPDRFDYVGAAPELSPMRLDLEEAVGKLGKEVFIVNAVLDADGRLTRFFCGHPVEAHRAAVGFVQSLAAVEVPEPADLVLAGSYPMDSDLRQGSKCLGNTLFACKPGGVMLGLLRCENGIGEVPAPRRPIPYPLLRGLVRLIGRKRILPLVERARRGEPVEEIFVGHFALQMLRRNQLGIFSERLPADADRSFSVARVFSRLDRLLEWAARTAPRRATVWVFPAGGVTYVPQGARS